MRSPRRTAQTAAALMVGLALVSAMSVFGASLSKSTTSSIDNAVSADLIVTGPSSGFPNSVVKAVSDVPGVTASSTVYQGQFEFKGSLATVVGVSTDHLADTVILQMQAGTSQAALAAGQMLIDTTTAKRRRPLGGISVVPVKFALTGTGTIRIGGIFEPNALIGHYVVGSGFFLFPLPQSTADRGPAGRPTAGQACTTRSTMPPILTRTSASRREHSTRRRKWPRSTSCLGIVYALLALAVLIALIGIVNTLLLSVFERTHEIGLLRAVGMKRRQIRAMIRSEAVILALFGAIIGIVVGTGLGTALASLAQEVAGDHRRLDPLPQPGPCSSSLPPCSVWSQRVGQHGERPSSTCWLLSPPIEADLCTVRHMWPVVDRSGRRSSERGSA